MTDVTMQLWYNSWERPNIFFPTSSSPHSGVSSLLFNRYLGFSPETQLPMCEVDSFQPIPTRHRTQLLHSKRARAWLDCTILSPIFLWLPCASLLSLFPFTNTHNAICTTTMPLALFFCCVEFQYRRHYIRVV